MKKKLFFYLIFASILLVSFNVQAGDIARCFASDDPIDIAKAGLVVLFPFALVAIILIVIEGINIGNMILGFLVAGLAVIGAIFFHHFF